MRCSSAHTSVSAWGAEGRDERMESFCDDDDGDSENDIECGVVSLRVGVLARWSFSPAESLSVDRLRDQRHSIEGALVVEVFATNSFVDLSIVGARQSAAGSHDHTRAPARQLRRKPRRS